MNPDRLFSYPGPVKPYRPSGAQNMESKMSTSIPANVETKMNTAANLIRLMWYNGLDVFNIES